METDILAKMKAYEDAGIDRDTALAQAIEDVATDLGTTKADILEQIGKTEEALRTEFDEGIADLSGQVTQLETDILAKMKAYEDAGIDRDTALAQAIEDVATDLGTTKADILEQIGKTEEALRTEFDEGIADLSGQLEDTRTEILDKVAEYEANGLSRDEALSKAIDDVAGNLDTTRQELLDQLGVTEENLANDIAGVSSDLQIVADYVGKPASEVTDADIDFVADIIAQQEALSDPTSFVPTDQQLQYDVNNDGVIDINDQNMLEQALAGQDVSLGGQFEATGLYAYNDAIAAQQKADQEAQFAQEQQLEADRQLELQTQINRNEQLNKFDQGARDLLGQQAAQPSIVTNNQSELAKIGRAYDFKSIFRDEEQEQFYNTPFGGYGPNPFDIKKAKGGIIEDDTDRLIRLIGES
jgi:hypothetical protein